MTKQDLVERMQQGQAWIPGKRVKIDFGGSEGAITRCRRVSGPSTDDQIRKSQSEPWIQTSGGPPSALWPISR